MRLSPSQIYQYAVGAGFPPDKAVTMVAIALRESSGITDAMNVRAPRTIGPNDPGEASYGLWQINMLGTLGERRMTLFGLTDPRQLIDPAVNAAAAFKTWNGNDANLGQAWYIDGRAGQSYVDNYVKYLPVARQAQADYLASSGGSPPNPTPAGQPLRPPVVPPPSTPGMPSDRRAGPSSPPSPSTSSPIPSLDNRPADFLRPAESAALLADARECQRLAGSCDVESICLAALRLARHADYIVDLIGL